jgi:hypothetical protein
MPRYSREWNGITDVLEASYEHDQTLEAEAETSMRN